MKKLTQQDGQSLDIVNENLESLKGIFPEAFAEDGVDFEVLRQLLGDAVADGEEKYGLNWYGKKKARQIALTPSLGTLRPCKEESVDWDTTQNLFIEGDNLEVLKLLQKSYANKVKMIYIDPPFNTGKEFIYPDKFQDNLDTYLRYTGQKDDEGFKLSSNTESSGRYHTNWLNMMLPRLKLARGLLKEDGVIFISIDDGEVANLRKICDEIFGEENLIAKIVWKKSYGGGAKSKHAVILHEYILMYSKSKEDIGIIELPPDDGVLKYYKYKDNQYEQRGPYRKQPLATNSMDDRPNLKFPIHYEGHEILPEKQWQWSKERVNLALSKDELVIRKRKGGWTVDYKQYLKNEDGVVRGSKLFTIQDGPYTQIGTGEIKNLFGNGKIFTFPKPSGLIRHLAGITSDDDLILDFFAGSCPTAHAILNLNSIEGGNRRFIMVQLPEQCDKTSEAFKFGYKTIAEIGKERIRRVAEKLKEENPDFGGDLGFKVFKLDSSNISAWNPDRNNLEQTLLDHLEHLVEGRSEEDVLYELLLKRGVDLTVPIEEKSINGKTVYSIGYGVLFACLDTTITQEQVEVLAMGIMDWRKELEPSSDTQVVFRDSAFDGDIAKTNMTAILQQHGIAHVRSL